MVPVTAGRPRPVSANGNVKKNNAGGNNRQPKLILQESQSVGSARSRGSNNKTKVNANRNSNAGAQGGNRPPAKNKNNNNKPAAATARSNAQPQQKKQPQLQKVQQQAAASVRVNKQQGGAGAGAGNTKNSLADMTLALQTANSIAINRTHPRQAEVIDLLRTHEKGWIDDRKFTELLRGLIF